MLGGRLLSSLLLWGLVIALVVLRYTNGVFLLIAVTGLAATLEACRERVLAARREMPAGRRPKLSG